MSDLFETVAKNEDKKATKRSGARNKQAAIKKLMTGSTEKDLQISAKVNSRTYELFRKINSAQGLSNNSALNMLISRYVRENRDLLDE